MMSKPRNQSGIEENPQIPIAGIFVDPEFPWVSVKLESPITSDLGDLISLILSSVFLIRSLLNELLFLPVKKALLK